MSNTLRKSTPLPPTAAPEPRAFLSRAEVADLFNVSPNTITRWADAGKLHYVRTLGGHRRYEKETTLELLNSQLAEPYPPEVNPPGEAIERSTLKSKTKEEADRVNRTILHIPRLYGDHHVAPVQQALANRPGIEEVLVSPAHRQVRVDFAPEAVDEAQIHAWLTEAGYAPRQPQPPLPVPEAPPVNKDFAWDRTSLRMTQTFGIGA